MALKDEQIQQALRRSNPNVKPPSTKYSHFKIYQIPSNESGHKPDTNWVHSEHKTVHKPDTKTSQTEHNQNQLADNQTQNGHETEHKNKHIADTNRVQTGYKNNISTSELNTFSSFVGIQRKILVLFYNDCKSSRSRETQAISLQHVADCLNIRIGSVKTSIKRLEEKGAIKRIVFKNGRSGWSKYELQEHIYREVMQYEAGHKLDTNWSQKGYKLGTEPGTELDTSVSSSSNLLNNKNNTTSDYFKLTEEWQAIDIEPLDKINFTQTHLIQIAQQARLTPEIVQKSIYNFAFDLFRNNKIEALKTKNVLPLNYFMGVVRKGIPYGPPSNYESPEEEAMRKYVERQRELEQNRTKLENDAAELTFKQWLTGLSEDEKKRLLSPVSRSLKGEHFKNADLKSYFIKEIWPNKRDEIIKN